MTRELFVPSSQMRLSMAGSAASAGRTWASTAGKTSRKTRTIADDKRLLVMDKDSFRERSAVRSAWGGPDGPGLRLPIPAFVPPRPEAQVGMRFAPAPEPSGHLFFERLLGLARDRQAIPERMKGCSHAKILIGPAPGASGTPRRPS